MSKLDSVNPTPAIPRSPPVHREKRRRESGSPPDKADEAHDPTEEKQIPGTEDNSDQTIDEYA